MHFRFDTGPLSVRWGGYPEFDVFLMRHGQSETNVDRAKHLEIADPEVKLTSLGHQQAKEGAKVLTDYLVDNHLPSRTWLKTGEVRLYHSDYMRAHQTAEHVMDRLSRNGIKYSDRMDHRIRELEFGVLTGLEKEEIIKNFPYYYASDQLLREQHGRFYQRRFGGESPADVADRCKSFISALYRDWEKHGITTFIVVNHGLTSRVLAMLLTKSDRYWYEQQENPTNCAVRHIKGKIDLGYIHGGTEE